MEAIKFSIKPLSESSQDDIKYLVAEEIKVGRNVIHLSGVIVNDLSITEVKKENLKEWKKNKTTLFYNIPLRNRTINGSGIINESSIDKFDNSLDVYSISISPY